MIFREEVRCCAMLGSMAPIRCLIARSFSRCGYLLYQLVFFFFFQAEDGIRDGRVTGVQTCALPIWSMTPEQLVASMPYAQALGMGVTAAGPEEVVGHLDWAAELCTTGGLLHGGALKIGRASCRERV